MTGPEVILEIVRQMREIIAQPDMLGYERIEMGREEQALMQTYLEDVGVMPVIKRRLLPVHGCTYHGVPIELRDEPIIKVHGLKYRYAGLK